MKAEPSSPDDGRNLPAYVFKGHVSSEGDLTPPSLSGASSQESMSEQDETEAAEAQAEECDDSPAASGAPSASASCAPSFVRDFNDGDDGEDLGCFWCEGPGRFWQRPS